MFCAGQRRPQHMAVRGQHPRSLYAMLSLPYAEPKDAMHAFKPGQESAAPAVSAKWNNGLQSASRQCHPGFQQPVNQHICDIGHHRDVQVRPRGER